MSPRVFLLPDLGEGLTEADILEWHVAVGDTVAVDSIIATVETAKASVELPCPYAGVVAELHGAEGETIAVGSPFISVTTDAGAHQTDAPAPSSPAEAAQARAVETYRTEEQAGSHPAEDRPLIGRGISDSPRRRRRAVLSTAQAAPVEDPAVTKPAPAESAVKAGPTNPEAAAASPSTSAVAVRVISPLVRRLAAEHGIELSTVTPSGANGVITRADVEASIQRGTALSGSAAAAAGAPLSVAPAAAPLPTPGLVGASGEAVPAPGTEIRVPITGVRRMIASKLEQSRREIPDASTWVDVDASALMDMRAQISAVYPEAKIGLMALVARMCIAGLRQYPELNARVDAATQEIVRLGSINLSFAAQSPRGLVVPVVHDADQLTTRQLAHALRELTGKAREGSLTPAELTGGTFTLNNYGVYGVDGSTPIINHPEVAMLGMGHIMERPGAVGGELTVRQITQLSFTFDHRVCDGGVAGGFIRFVADCIERPASLVAAM